MSEATEKISDSIRSAFQRGKGPHNTLRGKQVIEFFRPGRGQSEEIALSRAQARYDLAAKELTNAEDVLGPMEATRQAQRSAEGPELATARRDLAQAHAELAAAREQGAARDGGS